MNNKIDIKIEPMTKDDLDEVVEIERRIFPCPWTRSQFKAEISNPFCHYMVAKAEGRVIGYVGFVSVEDEGYITNIAVNSRNRQKGVGTLLLVCVFEKAVESGVRRLLLDVRRSNLDAQRLYHRFGFTEVAIRKNYYSDNFEDAIVMASELSRHTRAPELIERIKFRALKNRMSRSSV